MSTSASTLRGQRQLDPRGGVRMESREIPGPRGSIMVFRADVRTPKAKSIRFQAVQIQSRGSLPLDFQMFVGDSY